MSKLDKIKTMLQNILVSFNQVSTTKGILVWDDGESLPKAGDNVWVLDTENERIPTEDGDYVLQDGTVIQVQNGVVVAIVLPSAEEPVEETPVEEPENKPEEEPVNEPEEPVEEPSEEQPEEPEQPEITEPEQEIEEPEQTEPERNLEEEVARLERENGELRERIAELEDRIKELENEPAAKSAQEEFKEVAKIAKTGNKQLDNLARIMNAK